MDQVKDLQEKRSKFESGILKLSGAASLAASQVIALKKGHSCALCGEKNKPSSESIRLMKETLQSCAKTRDKLFAQHKECKRELQTLHGEILTKPTKHTNEWHSIHYKEGIIAALREQKSSSLRLRECTVCGSELGNIANFLRRVDRQIQTLSSKVHVHHQN